MILVTVFLAIIGIYLNDHPGDIYPDMRESLEQLPADKLKTTLMWTFGLFGIFLTALMGGVYYLLYGLLLRKLKRNYGELAKLEF